MTRRSLARETASPLRRLAPLSALGAIALAAVATFTAVRAADARPVPVDHAANHSVNHMSSLSPAFGPRAPQSERIWIPQLWQAPAFHAPIRLQAARLAARAAALEAARFAPPAPDDATPIDWRVLAGLDYLTGKATDTLKKIEGKEVRIPGFVVPLDDFMEDGAEFLLVPYYGACVHTPPPPPNQIIFVQMAGKKAVKLTLFDAVWMYGKLKIATVESPYGTVGFTLEGDKMEPYSSK